MGISVKGFSNQAKIKAINNLPPEAIAEKYMIPLNEVIRGEAAILNPIPVTTDPYWANVVLSMPMADITDVSPMSHTPTNNGGVTFGNDGTWDYAQFNGSSKWITVPNSSDWNFGSGAFTIEFHANFTARGQYETFLSLWQASPLAWQVQNYTSSNWGVNANALSITITANGSTAINKQSSTGTWTPVLGQWYHVALSRTGGTLYMFVDGIIVASVAMTETIATSSQPLAIGVGNATTPYWPTGFNGKMSNLRITKGVARYTADFSGELPTAAFPTS